MNSGTSEEVTHLLHELRSSSGLVERGKLLRRGVDILRRLTPEERRHIALEVAAHAAPDVVPRLNQELGTDLTPGQMATTLEMLRRLDDEQLRALTETLQDPEQRRVLAEQVARAGAEGAAAAAGLDLPVPDEDQEWGEEDDEVERHLVEDVPAGAGSVSVELAEELEVEPFDVAPAPEAETPDWFHWEERELSVDDLRFEPRTAAQRSRPTARPGPRRERHPEPEDDERSWFGGVSLGIGQVGPATVPLARRLHQLERTSQRLDAVTGAMDEFRAMDTTAQVAVLRALPEGWARRRAFERLIRADGVAVAAVPRLLGTLSRPMDRTWVAATLIEASLLELDRLDEVLDPRAAARLRRRYAA